MTQYTPSESYSVSIVRPACPKCGTRMMLAGVSYLQGRPDHDERTFDCPKCENELSEIVKFK
jgi:hypothetical protein